MIHHTGVWLRYLLLALAIGFILLYIFVAISRLGYPYELEWQEGRALDHVERLLTGKSIYPPPTLEFIPLTYTPLYFLVSALAALVTGIGFLTLRLVSLLSSLGLFYLTYLFIKRETASSYQALIAVGLLAATYKLGGSWFDIARVDSLFLLLLLAGFYLIRFGKSFVAVIAAAILITFSYLTKQSALVFILPMLLFYLLIDWRKFLLFTGIILTVTVSLSIILDGCSNGWYSFYTLFSPLAISKYIAWGKLKSVILDNLVLPGIILLILSVSYIIIKKEAKVPALFYLLFFLGMVVGMIPFSLNIGGYYNCLIPAFIALAILAALMVNHLEIRFKAYNPFKREMLSFCLYAACIVQFGIFLYNPLDEMPTKADREAGDMLVSYIAQIKGEVLVPSHPYLAVRAGKKTSIHSSALQTYLLLAGKSPDKPNEPDSIIYPLFERLYRSEGLDPGDDFYEQLRRKIADKYYSAIILDSELQFIDIKPSYYYAGKILQDDVFWTYTGGKTRPNLLYLPTESENVK